MTRAHVAWCALLALALFGCSDTIAATFVAVEIDAEPGVRSSTAALRVVVNGSSGTTDTPDYAERFSQTFTLAADDLVWPRSVTVEPARHDASRLFEIVATALDDDGGEVAVVRARTGFVPHAGRSLRLVFDDGCIAKRCALDETCRDGDCESAHIDPIDLDDYKPHLPSDGGVDASNTGGDSGVSGVGGPDDAGGIGGTGGGGTGGSGGVGGATNDAGGVGGAGDGGGSGGVGGSGGEPDAGTDAGPADGFPFVPSNFVPSGIVHSAAATLACGETVFDSRTLTFSNWCAGQPMPSVVTIDQDSGSDAVVLGFESLTLAMGHTLAFIGDKPVIVAVFGDATINGHLSADGDRTVSGAGGEACGAMNGAGGGFGSVGGASLSQPGGATRGSAQLVPLFAGCVGGASTGAQAGGAGGALQLSVAGRLTITGTVSAAGGGGLGGNPGSGGGGGSGGAILLEANALTLDPVSWLSANGGGGGGASYNSIRGGDGGNAPIASANGGTAGVSGLPGIPIAGGRGAGASTQAQPGGAGTSVAGGGGGGVGRIRIRGESSCEADGNMSPAATRAGNC